MTEYVQVPRENVQLLAAELHRRIEEDGYDGRVLGWAGTVDSWLAATPEAQVAPQGGGEVVDLEQFRPALCSWRQDALKRVSVSDRGTQIIMEERIAEADRLLAIIDKANTTHPAGTLSGDVEQVARELPERDASKRGTEQGLYRKFDVRRTDGSDEPGGKHDGCEYFVLDATHDPGALPALAAYAAAVKATHPELAADMVERYGLAALSTQAPDPLGAVKKLPAKWLADAERIGGRIAANAFGKCASELTAALSAKETANGG